MRFLPVFLDLASGTVALVGSGPAALNKLRLLRAGLQQPDLQVVLPGLCCYL